MNPLSPEVLTLLSPSRSIARRARRKQAPSLLRPVDLVLQSVEGGLAKTGREEVSNVIEVRAAVTARKRSG
ncbi:MAG: hypothetical protein AAGA46_09715 [Cyanobacteria bacterium P01_F01_bin.13]